MKAPRARGFTLIEVVVALAIVAVGMLAVFKTIGDTARNVNELRDRSLAEWIADNRITEIRVSGQMPSVDETAGELDFGNQHWHWLTKVSQTQVEGIRRIDVSVRREEDPEGASIVTLSGFVGRTAVSAPPSRPDWYGDDEGGGEGDGEDDGNADDGEEPEEDEGGPE